MGAGAIASVCFAWISDRIPAERRNQSFGVVTVVASVTAFLGFFFGPILYGLFPLPMYSSVAPCSALSLWPFFTDSCQRASRRARDLSQERRFPVRA